MKKQYENPNATVIQLSGCSFLESSGAGEGEGFLRDRFGAPFGNIFNTFS